MAINQVPNSQHGGRGIPVRIGSIDTALFWFCSATNWEVMVKVLDGCAVIKRYWVFGGALTDQGHHIGVTDTTTANPLLQRFYSNPLGTRTPAIADTNAFASCP